MIKDEIFSMIKAREQAFLSENELLKLTGPVVNYNKKELNNALKMLIDEGKLIVTERHKFALPERAGIIKGVLECNPKGFGFVRPESREIKDIFVHERNYNGAVHGDTVLVNVIENKSENWNRGRNRTGKNFGSNRLIDKKEGEIIKVISRRIKNIVGTVRIDESGCFVVPDDSRFAQEVYIDNKLTMGATTNKKVVVKIIEYPSRITISRGEIIEILGDVGEVGVDTLSIIRAYGLFEEFSDEVIKAAEEENKEPSAEEKAGRRNFTNDLVITIDGEDARDFDDAVSLSKDERGNFILQVHIADVSHYVKRGGVIDDEAFARATSVYFPDHVLPMLPVTLSNGICSLNPNVERLTLSVVMTLDNNANIKDYEIVNGVIKSRNRMTYTDVTKILEGDKEKCKEFAHLVPMLKDMSFLAEKLIKRLDDKGELDFDMPEVQIDMDEKNQIKEIRRKPRTMSERLIEMFMVLTNEVVARHIRLMGLPFVYRVHEIPSPEKMHNFNEFVKGVGLPYSIPETEPKPKDVQKVLVASKDTPLENIVGSLLLRSMQKARYAPEPLGHFGLALKDYCHFTSPIRRYPDLVVHRITKLAISKNLNSRDVNFYKDFVETASEQSSVRERLADEVEREVDNLKKAEYMSKRIGEEFEGIISGITENGFFVQLENTIEGFVALVDLPADNYFYDEMSLTLVGKGHKFSIGESVKVKTKAADLILRRVDFSLCYDKTEEEKTVLKPTSHNNKNNKEYGRKFEKKHDNKFSKRRR